MQLASRNAFPLLYKTLQNFRCWAYLSEQIGSPQEDIHNDFPLMPHRYHNLRTQQDTLDVVVYDLQGC